MRGKKTPELTGLDWRRVAWGGALVEALVIHRGIVKSGRNKPRRACRSRLEWRREREAIGAVYLDRLTVTEGAKQLGVHPSRFMVLVLLGLESYSRDVDTSILEWPDETTTDGKGRS